MNIKLQFNVERRLGDPTIKILIDEHMASFQGPCPDFLDLDLPVAPGEHELRIVHYGKKPQDHVYDEQGQVIVDRHVEIQSVVFDDVELVEELWSGEFFPVYDPDYQKDMQQQGTELPYFISPNLYLGHNGTWKLKFMYPAIDWVIQQRRSRQNKPVSHTFQTSEQAVIQARKFFDEVADLPWDRNFNV
jgi:hypothetical protein